MTTLYVKRMTVREDLTAVQLLFYQLVFSAPLLLVAALMRERGHPVIVWRADAVLSLVYQTIVVAAITYVVWFWLIQRYRVTSLGAFTFLTPLVGVILGGVLLGEALPPLLWVGVALAAAGIYLVNRPSRSVEKSAWPSRRRHSNSAASPPRGRRRIPLGIVAVQTVGQSSGFEQGQVGRVLRVEGPRGGHGPRGVAPAGGSPLPGGADDHGHHLGSGDRLPGAERQRRDALHVPVQPGRGHELVGVQVAGVVGTQVGEGRRHRLGDVHPHDSADHLGELRPQERPFGTELPAARPGVPLDDVGRPQGVDGLGV